MKSLVIIIAIAVACSVGLGLSVSVSAEEHLVPSWIKNTVGFWVDGQVSDTEFLNVVEYLANERIIQVNAVSERPQIYVIDGNIVLSSATGAYGGDGSTDTMCSEENDVAISASYGSKKILAIVELIPIGNPPNGYHFEAQNVSEQRGSVTTFVTCMR